MSNCRNCLNLGFGWHRLKTYRRTGCCGIAKGCYCFIFNYQTPLLINFPCIAFPDSTMNGASINSPRGHAELLPSPLKPVLGMGNSAPSCLRGKLSFLQSSLRHAQVLWGQAGILRYIHPVTTITSFSL